jgi:hypothetical protein
MKTIPRFSFLAAILLFLMAGVTMAQDANEEMKKKQAEEEMRKAMQAEEMKAKKEQLEAQREMMEKMEKQYLEQQERQREVIREFDRTNEPFLGTGYGDNFVLPYFHQDNQTQLTLRNNFRGGSDSSDGEFDLEEGTHYFRCMISGKVRSGSISIKVVYPGGKTFKELTINSSAEVNYSQSLSIKEGEEKKYLGTWKYSVEADKAEGNYILSISTN